MRARRRGAVRFWCGRSEVNGPADGEDLGVNVLFFFFAIAAFGIDITGVESFGGRSKAVPANRRGRRRIAIPAPTFSVVTIEVSVHPYIARRPYDSFVEA